MYAIKVGNEFLDLADNASITLEINSPFFMNSGIPGTISYPTPAINTKKNQRILGFPDIISNQETMQSSIEAELYIENLLYKTGFIRNIKPSKGGYSFTFSSDAGDFQSRITGVSMQSLDLGTDTLNLVTTNTNYALFPVKNPGFYGDKNAAFKGYVNYYHSGAFLTNTTSDGFYCVVPFPYLVYVIRQLFAHFGYTVSGSWLEDADVNKIVIYNNYALDKITGGINVFESNIDFKNHVPDMTVGEFIVAIKNMFGLGFLFNAVDKSVQIITLNEVIEDQTYVDHSRKASPQFQPDPNEYNGFKLVQELDQGDEELQNQSDSWATYKVGNGAEEITTKASTIIFQYQQDLINTSRFWTITEVNQKGSSTEYDLGINKFSLRLLFDKGMSLDSLGASFPNCSYQFGTSSLLWTGTNGLYTKYHKQWLDFRAETTPVKRDVLFNVTDILTFNVAKKYMIDYNKFLYEKITCQVPQKGGIRTSKTEMYKIRL